MGKVSIIVGVVAALVVVAVVVVVVVVVVLGGIDTSPITEVTETKVVSLGDNDSIQLTDDYYYVRTRTGDTTDTRKYTYNLTYRGGDTKSFSFDNAEKKHFYAPYNENTAAYYDSTATGDGVTLTFFNPFDTEMEHATITLERGPSFYNEDEFYTYKSDGTTRTYYFYSRDSGNKFVKSSFTLVRAGASDAKQTN